MVGEERARKMAAMGGNDRSVSLPKLAPVILPTAMREMHALGNEPGACLGPLCAKGGLHFDLKPVAWKDAPQMAMPAPGQMPSATATQGNEGMPSLQWHTDPVKWHNERDSLFRQVRRPAAQEQALRPARAQMQPATQQTLAKPSGLRVAAVSNHQLLISHSQQANSPGAVIMGNTAEPAPLKAVAEASRTKEEAANNLAEKLTKQIYQTDSSKSVLHAAPAAPPAHRVSPFAEVGSGVPVAVHKAVNMANKKAVLHKLAAKARAAHLSAASGLPSLAGNFTDFHHGNWYVVVSMSVRIGQWSVACRAYIRIHQALCARPLALSHTNAHTQTHKRTHTGRRWVR